MKFNYKNSRIKKHEIEKESRKILSAVSEMKKSAKRNDYNDCFASINLPFDSLISQTVKNLSKEYKDKNKKDKIRYILVIGIGGSNLGTVAVYEAVLGKLYNQVNQNHKDKPTILFADATDPDYISDIKNIVERALTRGGNILINCVSKSGTTTETAANFEIFVELLKKYKENYNDYIIITTDEDSKLWNLAKKNKFKILKTPKKVGGRFSVLSPVGLFPLHLAGINIDKLLEGARSMRNKCLNKNIFENPAALSAIVAYIHYKRGKNINVNFFFSNDFESVGKWLRQLIGESAGKEKNTHGKVVNVGITPVISTAVDLHSMAQLYLAGPSDKFTNFIRIKNYNENKSLSEITNAIIFGVQKAYIKRKIPFVEIILENKSEKSIGEFLQFKMMEIIFIAHLLEVNPFDQPNVEEYKIEIKKILAQK